MKKQPTRCAIRCWKKIPHKKHHKMSNEAPPTHLNKNQEQQQKCPLSKSKIAILATDEFETLL